MTYSSLLTCSFWSSLTHSAWHHLFPPFFSSFPHTFSTVNSCPTTATIKLHGKAIFLNFCNSKYILPIYVFSNICFQINFKESLKTCSLILSYHVHQMCKCVSESTGPKMKVVPKPPPQNFWYVKFEHSKLCFSQAPAWGWCSFVKCSLKELFVVIIHTDIVSKLLIYVIIMPLYIKLLKTRRLLHEAPNYFSPTAHLKGKILNTFFLVLLVNKVYLLTFLFAYIVSIYSLYISLWIPLILCCWWTKYLVMSIFQQKSSEVFMCQLAIWAQKSFASRNPGKGLRLSKKKSSSIHNFAWTVLPSHYTPQI